MEDHFHFKFFTWCENQLKFELKKFTVNHEMLHYHEIIFRAKNKYMYTFFIWLRNCKCDFEFRWSTCKEKAVQDKTSASWESIGISLKKSKQKGKLK